MYNQSKTQVSHLSLNKLVESLTPRETNADDYDIKTLMATYETFTTSLQLIRKLVERFEVPAPVTGNTSQWVINTRNPIQIRVIKIIRLFLEETKIIHPNTNFLIKLFVRRLMVEEPTMGKHLLKSIRQRVNISNSLPGMTLK